MAAEPARHPGINVDAGVIDDARRRQRRHRRIAIVLMLLLAAVVFAAASGNGPPVGRAIGTGLARPGSSSQFPASVYPQPTHSRGGALAACPNPSGLQPFTRADTSAAVRSASRYGQASEALDIRSSDRAWWPQVRNTWRTRSPRHAGASQTVSGPAAPASRSDYSMIVRFSCGHSLVARSLVVGVGPRQTHAPYCEACISHLFFVDRRGHALLYFVY
jgi:hypothetical protein